MARALDYEKAKRREQVARPRVQLPPTAKQINLLARLMPGCPAPETRHEASVYIDALLNRRS